MDVEDIDDDCACESVEAEETNVEEADNDTLTANLDSTAVNSQLTATGLMKYAPKLPTVKGSINLYCIALKWLNDPGSSLGSVATSGRRTQQTYHELSGGALNFRVVSKQIAVPFNKAAKNISKAEAYAKKQMPKPNNDFRTIYVIVNHGAKGFSNAGGDTAHLYGTLTRDFLHEVGHLRPFSLGHSGRYVNGKLEAYGDGTSFMGKFSTTRLTGAQLYLLGWLPQNKAALYELNDAPTDFNIEPLYADKDSVNVKLVVIPRADQRPLYISMPQINGKPTLCLHLSSGRGTQRVAVFGKQAEYQGVLVQKVADGDGFVTVRVSTVAG